MKCLYRYYLCLLFVLLPLKYCTAIGNGEQPCFPLDAGQWIIFTCIPAYFAVAMCGLALLFAAVLYPLPRRWLPVIPLALFPIAGLAGLLNTTEFAYAVNWLEHFAGAAALCSAIWIAHHHDRNLAPALMTTIGIMGTLCALHGWYQHFIGLEENRRFAMEQAAKGLLKISDTMADKLAQTRVYGTFSDPNVYSANLLFCLPFSLISAWRAGQRFEKPAVGSAVSVIIVSILYAGALFWSGSRGAAVGFAAAAAAGICCIPRVRNSRLKLLLPAGAALLAAILILIVNLGKSRGDFSTASARMTYYTTAVKIFAGHPIAGAGLGEFFPWYIRLKPAEAEVTREPHNLPLALLSQCGAAGGLTALAFYALPWLLIFCRRKGFSTEGALPMAAAIGTAAWSVHSLFQFNELIPGTMYQVAGVFALMMPVTEDMFKKQWAKWSMAAIGAALCLTLAHAPSEYLLQRDANTPDILDRYFTSKPLSLIAPRLFFDAHLYKMESHKYEANWKRALSAAEELVKRAPHRSTFHLRMAKIQFAMKNDEKARKALDEAILWAPSSKEVHLMRGILKAKKSTDFTDEQMSFLMHGLRTANAKYTENENGAVLHYHTDNYLVDACLQEAGLFPEENGVPAVKYARMEK